MATLESTLRSALEKAIMAAREEAEDAARAALDVLAVNQQRAFETLTSEQRALRNALRAKARQLGSGSQSTGFGLLVEEVAYVQWHRMLFPLFLAGNDLLMHPAGVAVTMEECEELAAAEGDQDRWATAARYASNMLPGIFPSDDPSGQITFAPEGRSALEAILNTLPIAVFTSDDGLGWVYQFWQSKKKKEVSGSGGKIEKLDLAAYSQLFTEDYMVRFLLENSLGAWWAARHPESPLVKGFKYLRFQGDGAPAAGSFSGWPERAADVTVMDPCCGSGHFLLVAFEMLRRMRMEEEGLGETQAADAVFRDNLFGLEIDPRCVQIAAFSLALAAWKVGGYHELPQLNVACSGIAVRVQLETWTKLAGDDVNMRQTLERLHELFANAPDLGSLIDPLNAPVRERMFTPDYGKVEPLLEGALAKERADDPVAAVFGNAALGVARAAELLARQYTLVATNVPYLSRGKQGDVLKDFIELSYGEAKADLSTAFLQRCRSFCLKEGSYAVVTPQNWMFLPSYTKLRQSVLREQTLRIVARLGWSAFETISGAVVNVALLIVVNDTPAHGSTWVGVDVSELATPSDKAVGLVKSEFNASLQATKLGNPESIITSADLATVAQLGQLARSFQGIKTGDDGRFRRCFWEVTLPSTRWVYYQSTVDATKLFGGLEHVLDWTHKGSDLARLQGLRAWGTRGVAVSLMGELRCAAYLGQQFDSNVAAVIPKDPANLLAMWAYCSSPELDKVVRRIAPMVKANNGTLAKLPFDLEHWQSIAEEQWPGGLPEPFSDDPTQWLFKGLPDDSTAPLQVAVARLLGYQWPQEGADGLSRFALPDGILPLVSLSGQEPAVERLRLLLAASYGDDWSVRQQAELLQQVGFADKGLDSWLRDGFFEQHCKLFHHRPFIWHIWDGRRDGFSVLVNYHKLDADNLNKLIYTYLGEWIRTQRSAEESGTPGASARLVAALELQRKLGNIRDGEPDHDIYVRWKSLREQPIGWNPDLNDGVRLNIRPFVEAGVLRSRVNVNWKKDRGRNSDGSERVNDMHFTLAQKRAAREAKTK